MNPQDLKRKQTEITQLREKIGEAETEKRNLKSQIIAQDRTISTAQGQIRKIEESITSHTRREVKVSEHAMLRYVERVIGIDLKELESKILPSKTADTVGGLGDGQFPVGDHIIRVRNGVVVTVLGKSGDKH